MDNQRSVIAIEKVCRLAYQPNKFIKTFAAPRQTGVGQALAMRALGMGASGIQALGVQTLSIVALVLAIPVANAAEQHSHSQPATLMPLSATGSKSVLPAPESGTERLGGLSDTQLTNLAADWDQLDAGARADLIAETRERMLPSQNAVSARNVAVQAAVKNGSAPLARKGQAQSQIRVRAQRRRYGRVVRQADGSLVRIETQVVTVRRRDPQRAFGVGFERRHRAAPSGERVRRSVTTTVSTRVAESQHSQPANVATASPNPPTHSDPLASSRIDHERSLEPTRQGPDPAPGVIVVSKGLD